MRDACFAEIEAALFAVSKTLSTLLQCSQVFAVRIQTDE